MIPFSSNINKFKLEYQKKLARYRRCDTITFGEVMGYEKAFLIQNMCPVISKYIKNEYIDGGSNLPVKLDGAFEKDLIQKAMRVLSLERQGKKLVFPDIFKIEKSLISQLQP